VEKMASGPWVAEKQVSSWEVVNQHHRVDRESPPFGELGNRQQAVYAVENLAPVSVL
jgi:hypothetical protein